MKDKENNKFKKFLQELEENPNLLEYLSEDRLDKLIMYYEKMIREKFDIVFNKKI